MGDRILTDNGEFINPSNKKMQTEPLSEKMKAEHQELKAEGARLRGVVAAQKNEISNISKEISNLKDAFVSKAEELNAANEKIAELICQIEELSAAPKIGKSGGVVIAEKKKK